MNRLRQAILLAGGLLAGLIAGDTALAQKPGGVLKMYFFDSPASMSIHEEATIAGQGPMMGVFNNLVMYDQHIAQTSINTIVPDLASEWSWDEDKTGLTFKLRQGVKWHDGKPFTAKDVKCTFDLLQGKSADKLRLNPRKAWYRNLEEVVPNGDHDVTFRLKRPQPYFVALLASGFTPIYPCHVAPTNVLRSVIINRDAQPFGKPEIRRAIAMTLDRQAFIDTLTQGKGIVGGALLSPPFGVWGMPPDLMKTLPGYGPDVAANRAEARKLMEKLGYGPNNRLQTKISTRNIPPYRDPAVILIDQLKEIYIDGELEPIDTTVWYPRLAKKDFTIGLNLIGNGLDEPDQTLYENYTCSAEGNYDGYCNPELDKMVDRQSMESDAEKRRKLVWEIEKKLAEDVARPILYHSVSGTCWHPYVKGYTMTVNAIYNGIRMEDVWLDK